MNHEGFSRKLINLEKGGTLGRGLRLYGPQSQTSFRDQRSSVYKDTLKGLPIRRRVGGKTKTMNPTSEGRQTRNPDPFDGLSV